MLIHISIVKLLLLFHVIYVHHYTPMSFYYLFLGGNSMGVNGGVGARPPNQQSAVLSNAMLHSNMNAQR